MRVVEATLPKIGDVFVSKAVPSLKLRVIELEPSLVTLVSTEGSQARRTYSELERFYTKVHQP